MATRNFGDEYKVNFLKRRDAIRHTSNLLWKMIPGGLTSMEAEKRASPNVLDSLNRQHEWQTLAVFPSLMRTSTFHSRVCVNEVPALLIKDGHVSALGTPVI